MTRKDFVVIANALNASKPAKANAVWEATVNNMADALAHTNAAFDRGRFIAACRGE